MTELEAMRLALGEARSAGKRGDVPVGAVVLRNGEPVASGHNEREAKQDPTAHAEMLAITRACEVTDSWRLNDCTLVVTLEPCVMCAGAIIAARIARVVFGAYDSKAGAMGSLYNVAVDPRLNHETEVGAGLLGDECGQLLKDFFAARRSTGGAETATEL